ncbi:MAG TPA: fumarylacetoacetate hydrolase family protein [Steroidobacteraceae bacterium]|nr:fumarylacetoacetate hydrolase family protein [Steroidobacteraceae bacterium]
MKLATLEDGTRDGRLVVVSRDLSRAVAAPQVAATLQDALDDWSRTAPQLDELAKRLERGAVDGAVAFDPAHAMAPLPRAHHWVDGSAYVNHVELVRKARNAEMPPSFWSDPLVYQGGSDDLLGPMDDVPVASEEYGIDLEAEVAVVTDDVPMLTGVDEARGHIKLLMLVNDWSLRNLIPAELAKGFGFYQSKPATAFSPCAVTPDELGDAWSQSKVHLPLVSHINGQLFGEPDAGVDMTFDFSQLIAHVTKTRRLGAGTIIGSGTVSNYDRSKGSCCLAERRALETVQHGSPKTTFLLFGDRVRIEMFGRDGASIFGAIDQKVVPARSSTSA